MLTSGKLTRAGMTLLLCNAGLVIVAAVLHHAAAQDTPPNQAATGTDTRSELPATVAASSAPSGDEPGVDEPGASAATEDGPTTSTPATEQVAPDERAPNLGSPLTAAGSDPILEELRKIIRDPNSGLDVPPITMPPLGLATSEEKNVTSAVNESNVSARPGALLARVAQQRRRVNSLSQLTAAAAALTEEAEALADAGQAAAAIDLLKKVSQLRATIAELAAVPKS